MQEMTPELLSHYLISLANRIDEEENPSRLRTASDIRALIAAVESTAGLGDWMKGLGKKVVDFLTPDTPLAKQYKGQAEGLMKEMTTLEKIQSKFKGSLLEDTFDGLQNAKVGVKAFAEFSDTFNSPSLKKLVDGSIALAKKAKSNKPDAFTDSDADKFISLCKAVDSATVKKPSLKDKIDRALGKQLDSLAKESAGKQKTFVDRVNKIRKEKGSKQNYEGRGISDSTRSVELEQQEEDQDSSDQSPEGGDKEESKAPASSTPKRERSKKKSEPADNEREEKIKALKKRALEDSSTFRNKFPEIADMLEAL
jgi:hypothetical protein